MTFADDVVLVASSRRDMARMLTDLREESQKFGLKIHMGKTVVFTNQDLDVQRRSLDCKGCTVKIASLDESVKYLGRKFSMANHRAIEINARIACAWAAFM